MTDTAVILNFAGDIQDMARFKPGQSGNPAGKPKGTISKVTKLRQSIEKDVPAILLKRVEALEKAHADQTTA